MLCVLFLAARLRALQIDPVHGNPQLWAQICFYLCTYSVLAQTCFVLVVPFLPGANAKLGSSDGDVEFFVGQGPLHYVLLFCRYLMMVLFYGGATAVIVSMFTIQDSQ